MSLGIGCIEVMESVVDLRYIFARLGFRGGDGFVLSFKCCCCEFVF